MSVSYFPGTLARELCRSLLLPLEPLTVSTPLLEPSLTRSKAALRELRLPVVTDPRADTSLSQRSLVLIIAPITQTLFCIMWTLPSCGATGEPTQWVWCARCWPGMFWAYMAPPPANHHQKISLISASKGSWRDWKGKAGSAEKAVTKERFQVNGLLQLPSSLLLNVSPDWPEGTGALGAYSAIPYLKAERLAHHWGLVCSSHFSGHSLNGHEQPLSGV